MVRSRASAAMVLRTVDSRACSNVVDPDTDEVSGRSSRENKDARGVQKQGFGLEVSDLRGGRRERVKIRNL